MFHCSINTLNFFLYSTFLAPDDVGSPTTSLKMSSQVEDYTKNVLKVVVAQVCQIIGWNSINQSSLEVLVDTLDRFMKELTKQTYRITELCTLPPSNSVLRLFLINSFSSRPTY